MPTLLSHNNPRIKQIRKLLAYRKERQSSKLFIVEGIRHVGEAIDARVGVEYICYAPHLLTSDYAQQLIQEQSQSGVPCLAVDSSTFDQISEKEHPQGILAVVRQPDIKLESLNPKHFAWGVALVAPQDPGNIGTILRTIDAVGASGLLLLDDPSANQFCADAYHPNSVRASMGSIFWHPLVSATFTDFSHWVKDTGYTIYGTSAHARQDYLQVEKFSHPLILLMGSEREGLTPSQSAICDVMLKMPMKGHVTSLNLAVATGVMLYRILEKLF
jgi:TrmH family RNA methyltransferase